MSCIRFGLAAGASLSAPGGSLLRTAGVAGPAQWTIPMDFLGLFMAFPFFVMFFVYGS